MVLIPATDAGWREAIPKKTMMTTNGSVDGLNRLNLGLPSSITKVCGPNSTFASFVRGILKNEGRTAKEIKRVMRQFFPSHSQIKKFSVGLSKKDVKAYYKSRQAILLHGFQTCAYSNVRHSYWYVEQSQIDRMQERKSSREAGKEAFLRPDLKTALSYKLSDETLCNLEKLDKDQKTLCTVAKIFLDKRRLKFENIETELNKGSFGENKITEKHFKMLFKTQAIQAADKRLEGQLKPYLKYFIGAPQQDFIVENLEKLQNRHSWIFRVNSNLYYEMEELWYEEHERHIAFTIQELKRWKEGTANYHVAQHMIKQREATLSAIYDEPLWAYELEEKEEVIDAELLEVEENIEPDVQEQPTKSTEFIDLLSKLNLL